MTHEEVKALVEEMGLPYAYDHFAEGESPDPPFICFLYPKAENFGADNLVYYHFNRLDIEVYTDYKDPDMEATIEEVLTSHELYYEKSEVWIETEKTYAACNIPPGNQENRTVSDHCSLSARESVRTLDSAVPPTHPVAVTGSSPFPAGPVPGSNP